MHRILGLLIVASVTGCYVDGPGRGYGYGGAVYGGPAYVGAVGFDGFYDGGYGAFYDGYWGRDRRFYYTNGPGRPYRADLGGHFQHYPRPGFQPVHGGRAFAGGHVPGGERR